MKINSLILFLWIAIVLTACSKGGGDRVPDDGAHPPGEGGNASWGTGVIYYTSPGEGVVAIHLADKSKKGLLPNSNSRHDWDLTKDGSLVIESTLTTDNDYDRDLYLIRKVSDGTVIRQFRFTRPTTKYTWLRFSPDGAQVAVNTNSASGVFLLNNQGAFIRQLSTINNQNLALNIMAWAPDNTLLVMVGNKLYRSDKTFTNATYITDIVVENIWGMPQVSPDGKKIAYATGGHIWMMNADGSNKQKVTTSSSFESMPRFSPDSKYLLIGTGFITPVSGWGGTGVFSNARGMLAILPADGQQYNVDYGADNRVVQIRLAGKNNNEMCSGSLVWR